eukprot:6209766-Pleurochrysis_carterae.AAC.2
MDSRVRRMADANNDSVPAGLSGAAAPNQQSDAYSDALAASQMPQPGLLSVSRANLRVPRPEGLPSALRWRWRSPTRCCGGCYAQPAQRPQRSSADAACAHTIPTRDCPPSNNMLCS